MTTEDSRALQLRCYNEKCLYYEENNCSLGAWKVTGIHEKAVPHGDQVLCELPLEFSFEADSLGENTVYHNSSEFPVHQNNESIVPNYNARNFASLYPKNEQSNSKNYIDNSFVGKIQFKYDSNYYNPCIPTYPPCVGTEPWDYGYCYGTNGNEPCQFSGVVDMEDFMNNEKRKEKSRDAARCRRSRESDIFNDLATSLPLLKEEVDHLDKASIMRLSIACLKVHNMLELFPNIQSLSKFNDGDYDLDSEDVKVSPLIHKVDTEKLALKSLDGFLLILSGDGEITYVSENISEFLGLSQIDLLGQPIWDYSHQCDHEEIRDALHGRHLSPSEMINGTKDKDFQPHVQRDFFLRLKCTLTSRGRSVNIKSASYKVIHITGHIAYSGEKYRQLVAIARPLPHPANIEIPLGSSTFLTKHSLDMKFSYVDDKMSTLLGYEPEHLLSKSLFGLHHGEDSESLLSTFKSLINKGQSETHRYRYLARCGGFVWVITQATVVYDKQKPQSVVCVNYAISGIEKKDEIYSCAQLEAYEEQKAKQANKETIIKTNLSNNIKKCNKKNHNNEHSIIVLNKENSTELKVENNNKIVQSDISKRNTTRTTFGVERDHHLPQLQQLNNKPKGTSVVRRPCSVTASIFAATEAKLKNKSESKISTKEIASTVKRSVVPALSKPKNRPQNATLTIFAPRTDDMNKGFLMFADDESGLTMLKDEPDDLTHLAPTAGDACIPLEDATPFFTDMFDDFMIPDSYSSLLPDDIHSLDSEEDSTEQKCIVPNQIVSNNGRSTNENSHSTNNNSNSNSSDPFINYRDESSDTNSLPHLLSPSGLAKSPDANSMPSLCSPDGSIPEDDLAFMTLNMEDEMDLRAPYIPMSEAEDLPLLISDDLMWGAHSETLTKELKNSISTITETIQQQRQKLENSSVSNNKLDSSLAALLCEQVFIPQPQTSPQQSINKDGNFIDSGSTLTVEKLKLIDQQNAGQIVNPVDVIGHPFKSVDQTINSWNVNDLMQDNGDTARLPQTTTIRLSQVSLGNPSPAQLSITARKLDNSKQLSNKRPNLVILTEPNSKRAKASSSSVTLGSSSIVATPELLQQLMGTPQLQTQKHQQLLLPSKPRIKEQIIESGRDLMNDSKININCSLTPKSVTQPSSSVLMNLLVSGCDNIPPKPPQQLMDVDDSNDSLQDNCQDSETYEKQLKLTSNGHVSNPLISGGNVLLCSQSRSTTGNQTPAKMNDMVSPSLLTGNDLEIWKEIQSALKENRNLDFLDELDNNPSMFNM